MKKTILDIIKYNKTLQKRNNLSLINYKSFSDKYIYLESKEKGKGKEYNKYGDMIYEGEFLSGKRNGKGKEFKKNGLIRYEGEFLRGKRNGKGKEYYYYDYSIKFEGDYLNGNPWNGNFKFCFESYELKNGKGFVKEYVDGLIFEGEYLNGKRNGKGKEYTNDTDKKIIFEGEYLNGKKWTGIILGQYEMKNGCGKFNFEGKQREYLNGEKNGIWNEDTI